MATDDAVPVTSNPCLRCGGSLSDWGIVEFRTGGTSGAIKLLIGEWGELGEQKLALELRYCSRCGQVDLRLPPSE